MLRNIIKGFFSAILAFLGIALLLAGIAIGLFAPGLILQALGVAAVGFVVMVVSSRLSKTKANDMEDE